MSLHIFCTTEFIGTNSKAKLNSYNYVMNAKYFSKFKMIKNMPSQFLKHNRDFFFSIICRCSGKLPSSKDKTSITLPGSPRTSGICKICSPEWKQPQMVESHIKSQTIDICTKKGNWVKKHILLMSLFKKFIVKNKGIFNNMILRRIYI